MDIKDESVEQAYINEGNDLLDRIFDHQAQITDVNTAVTEGTSGLAVAQYNEFHSTVLEKKPEDLQPIQKSTEQQPDSDKPINLHETVEEKYSARYPQLVVREAKSDPVPKTLGRYLFTIYRRIYDALRLTEMRCEMAHIDLIFARAQQSGRQQITILEFE